MSVCKVSIVILALCLQLGKANLPNNDLQGRCTQTSSSSNPNFLQFYPPVIDDSGTTPIYFGLKTTFEENGENSGSIPSVQLALDAINHNPNLLEGYSLHYTLTESKCTESESVNSVFKQLFRPPGAGKKLGLIDASCTTAKGASSFVANYYNVTQITCSPFDIGDHIFKLIQSDSDIAPVLVRILSTFNWRKVALFVENEKRFIEMKNALKFELDSEQNITYSVSTLSSTNGSLQAAECDSHEDNIFDMDSRIFIIIMSSKLARQLFCKASQLGMMYPKYLFLMYGSYESNWWVPPLDEDVHHQCSTQERAKVLEHSLAVFHEIKDSGEIGADIDVGKLVQNYSQDYFVFDRVDCPFFNFTNYQYAHYCFDATWALALALNKTIADLNNNRTFHELVEGLSPTSNLYNNGEFGIENFVYNNNVLSDRIQLHVQQTNLLGKTGHITFGAKRQRNADNKVLMVVQYRECTRTVDKALHHNNTHKCMNDSFFQAHIASFDGGDLHFTNGENNDTIWPNGIPYDGSIVNVTVTVSVPLTVIFHIMATTGVVLTFLCFLFNFIFRKTKIVRLTSPNLNYLILVGTVLLYVTVFWYFTPSTNPTVIAAACSIQMWTSSIGYVLALGTIVAKLWRVYYIFRNPDSTRKHTISDWQLMGFVLTLVITMVFIIIIYMIIEGVLLHFETGYEPSQEQISEEVGELEVNTHYFIITCSSNRVIRNVFVALIFLPVIVLQLSALFFAFKTRKVRIKGLNDAKHITAIVYISSIASLIEIILVFTIRSYINLYPAIFNLSFLVTATIILGFVFLPKMISLYKDPEGEHIFSFDDEDVVNLSTMFLNENACRDCQKLRTKVRELELCLLQMDESTSDPTNIRRSCPALVSDVSNPNFLHHDRSNSCGSESTASSPCDDTLSYDDYQDGHGVSWASDGLSYRVGERV